MGPYKRKLNDPTMSDRLLLVSVEDLINLAMGPSSVNIVNFKLIQQILHILARQLRLLEQRVEIRIREPRGQRPEGQRGSSDSSTSGSPRAPRKQSVQKGAKGVKGEKDARAKSAKEPKTDAKATKEAKDDKNKTVSKDKEKTDKAEKGKELGSKDKEKSDKSKKEDQQKEKESGSKAQGKSDKTPKVKEAGSKDKEKIDKSDKGKETDPKDKGKSDKTETGKGGGSKDKAEKDKESGAKSKDKSDKTEKDKESGAQSKDGSDKTDKDTDTGKGKSEKSMESSSKGKERSVKEKGLTESRIDEKETKPGEVMGEVVEVSISGSISADRSGSVKSSKTPLIEVVTVSEFDHLRNMVDQLARDAGPLPPLAFPDNDTLRADLATGRASLTGTMQAMQVNARVQAAEEAIRRMSQLLTQLASSGSVPKEFAGQLASIQPLTRSVGTGTDTRTGQSMPPATRKANVTREEMENALYDMGEDLNKMIANLVSRANNTADTANGIAKTLAERLEGILKMDKRISNITALINDYTEQLSGLDVGFASQIQGVAEQMVHMRGDLRGGLDLLEQVNNNAETTAIMELTERYNGLVADMDRTLLDHQALTSFQSKLGDDIRNLNDAVEMLQEQKSDKDEVQDGLRDKADISRLNGLLTEVKFEETRQMLEERLDSCHDKFSKQEAAWMKALKDLQTASETKADLAFLQRTRIEIQQSLEELNNMANRLEQILGDPKAAMTTRKIGRDHVCGACLTPAYMDFQDKTYGMPPRLPPLRPPPVDEEPCERKILLPPPPVDRHICLRWCGGSHTLLSQAVTKEEAKPRELEARPTRKYVGFGDDLRMYMMEEDLQPCLECNLILAADDKDIAESTIDGAGDQAPKTEPGK